MTSREPTRSMAATYSLILRACPEGSREAVAQILGRAFSLKESTCVSIASSTPIVLLSALSRDEAAALSLAMAPLQMKGANIEFSTADVDDLPKIDWPRRPMVFKRDIAEHVADFQLPLACPSCRKSHTLIEMLAAQLAASTGRQHTSMHAKPNEFKGTNLPEITPFSNQVLPPSPASSHPVSPLSGSSPASSRQGDGDAMSRLNELFPEEEAGFVPNNDDITSILDRLLPDEEQKTPSSDSSRAKAAVGSNSSGGSGRLAIGGAGPGFSVFLAKITDDTRRAKVVAILIELAKLSQEEADALSKKVIIPVLKGVSKEEAENAKQRFAKIGILARVKGPEG